MKTEFPIKPDRTRDTNPKQEFPLKPSRTLADIFLPEYPYIDDGNDLGRPSSRRINNVGPRSPSEIRANLAAKDDTIPVVFGSRKVQGKPFVWKDADGLWFLGWGFALGEANDITAIIIDDVETSITLSTNPQAVGSGRIYTAGSGQDVSSYVVTFVSGYSDTLDDQVLFFSTFRPDQLAGEPLVFLKMEGRKDIYDPRLDSGGAGDDPANASFQAYTVTPALCAAKMADLASGGNLTINWDDVETVADHNETLISGSPRHTVNIVCDRDQSWRDWMDYFAFVGMFVWWEEAGQVRMQPDWTASPVMTVTAADMVPGSFRQVNGDPSYDERPDNVVLTYYDATDEIDVQVPAVSITGNERTIDYRDSFGTDNHEEAKRLSVTINNRYTLEPIILQFDMYDRGLLLETWDLITVNYAPKSINTQYRVARPPQQIEPGVWRITTRIYNASTYDTSATAAPTANPIGVTSISSIPTPTVDSVTIVEYVAPDQFKAEIIVQNPEFVHLRGFIFQVWKSDESEMIFATETVLLASMEVESSGPPETRKHVIMVPREHSFKVRAIAVNTLDNQGTASAYVASSFASGVADPGTVPSLAGLTATTGVDVIDSIDVKQYVDVTWTDPNSGGSPWPYAETVEVQIGTNPGGSWTDDETFATVFAEPDCGASAATCVQFNLETLTDTNGSSAVAGSKRVRARIRSRFGAIGAWVETSNFSPAADPTTQGESMDMQVTPLSNAAFRIDIVPIRVPNHASGIYVEEEITSQTPDNFSNGNVQDDRIRWNFDGSGEASYSTGSPNFVAGETYRFRCGFYFNRQNQDSFGSAKDTVDVVWPANPLSQLTDGPLDSAD